MTYGEIEGVEIKGNSNKGKIMVIVREAKV